MNAYRDPDTLDATPAPHPLLERRIVHLRPSFAHVRTWVFDLDNTLYPHGSPIWPNIDRQITHYLAELFGVDGIGARALQKYYYERYGTTLRGLMEEHNIDVDEFLTFVHDVDRSALLPDAALKTAIAMLPGRRLILTNGSRGHAEATLRQLDLDGLFEDIFDIAAGGLVPKPEPVAYRLFLDRHGVEPAEAAMFEDIPRNLIEPNRLGMRTVLVVPPVDLTDEREGWEQAGREGLHIDIVTDDLAGVVAMLAKEAVPEAPPLIGASIAEAIDSGGSSA